ncbi:MAG: ribonuclease HII, partial [Promethearchaeota archaeon]
LMSAGTNLNRIEVDGFSRAINKLLLKVDDLEVVWLDSADVDPNRFKRHVRGALKKKVNINSLHKADEQITCVGAASIIAKVTRDRIINSLKEEYGDFGSGYPSDSKTREFLKRYYKKHGKFPPETRLKWDTIEKLKKEIGKKKSAQTTLF